MRFPPPARFYAPLLVLVFGLAATWLDYELNLATDLARIFAEVADQAEATGVRVARLAERELARGDTARLAEDLAAWADEPWLKLVAITDEAGTVLADSANAYAGRAASETLLAPARRLAESGSREGQVESREAMIFGAFPVAAGTSGTAWTLLVFDRTDALVEARTDALRQLRWAASAIALLCFSLWAALHFGFAARLARLTRAVREFGAGREPAVAEVGGGDEVRELSEAFSAMAAQLNEREVTRARLECELLETTERERRRIGQDLHDGIGQQLTAASFATSALITALETAAPAVAPQAERLGGQIRETIANVRALSHGLAPVALEDEGLLHALHELAEATTRHTGVRCIFECTPPVLVRDAALAGHLYRIAQEAVNNALKHAAPREIRIGLERHQGVAVLEVDDDGGGWREGALASGGIGLGVMRHRAQLLGGTLEIGSPPAGGTRIACRIPSLA